MNCNQVDNLLQDYIDKNLPEAELRAIAEHRQTCNACEIAYTMAVKIRALMPEVSVPPHSEDFVNRVLYKAAENNNREKSVIYKVSAGAIAAGFTAWFIVTSTLLSTPIATKDRVYNVMVSNEVQTIKIAIESEYELDGVQMSVELSPNLELAGFGNRSSINWSTRLKKGTNVVKLPVVGLAVGNGEIITRIQMNGKEKIMQIQTNYQSPGNVRYQTNTNAIST